MSGPAAKNGGYKNRSNIYGKAVVTWICAQVFFYRIVQPGEKRKSLVVRVARGVPKRRYNAPEPAVMKHLEGVGGLAAEDRTAAA
eukprot:569435-Lingulodinium_polyedra.AAC.1